MNFSTFREKQENMLHTVAFGNVMKKNISTMYLDHAACTPLDREVFDAMEPYFSPTYGNPSSLHASGRHAQEALEDARARIARSVGAYADEIIFTGSGTESDNLALIGAARANRAHGTHILISAVEHKAILESARMLEHEGFTVTRIPVDSTGMVDILHVLTLIRADTILISVMLANNEIGTVLPIAALSAAVHERRLLTGFPLIHTDACQTMGYVHLDVHELGVDLMSLNSTKAYGPKGVGMLYKRRGVHLTPLIVGGEQERGFRAGTEGLPQIVGMAAAFTKAEEIRVGEVERLTLLRTYFVGELMNRIPQLMVNGNSEHHLPHIVHVSIPYVEGESMVLMLDDHGIEAATGSACSAHDLQPSHVLRAVGQSHDLLHGSVRFSMGRDTTHEALDRVLTIFPVIVEKLTQMSALTANKYIYAKNNTTV